MDPHAWVAVLTLAAAVTLFISRWVPLEATSLGIPIVLAMTGTLSADKCLQGFSSQAVVALGAIFVIGAGLDRSGVATLVARWLERIGGNSRTRTISVLMLVAAGLSAFMSNAATVAVFLPAVAVVSRRTGIAASRLMMPLAFACILGGTLTLIGTTPNLILGEELRLRTGEGLGMFEFAQVGGPMTLAGIAFMAFVGWRMLPRRDPHANMGGGQMPRDLAESYGFAQTLYRMKVLESSGIAGKSIEGSKIGGEYHLDILLVRRRTAMGERSIHPEPELVLQVGDRLVVEGEAVDAWRLAEEQTVGLRIATTDELDHVLGRGITLAEVTLSPRSASEGKTLKELHFRKHHGVGVVSIWRQDEVITAGVGDVPLQLGDALLISGAPKRIRELAMDRDYVVLGKRETRGEDVRRSPIAIGLLGLAIVPPLFGWAPLAFSAMAAAVLMVLLRCLPLDAARRSIDFTILLLIVGTIPLGTALEETGVAAQLAQGLLSLEGQLGTSGLLGALFLVAAILSTTSNNGAAAVILAPVAAEAAEVGGADIKHTFLAVAMGASCAFVLPFAHQCNLMVMGPAGYGTRDFVRVGSVLSVIVTIVAVATLAYL